MTLEELLYARLTSDATLSSLLGNYAGAPAIFEQFAPDDTAPGWGRRYPRIEFQVIWQQNFERRVAGSLVLAIVHEQSSLADLALVESRLRELLDGAAFQPLAGTVSTRWGRADPLEVRDTDYRGLQVAYDLLAWPEGLTGNPDPVVALRGWSAARWPELQVSPTSWSPSDLAPALYWRLAGLRLAGRNAAVAWYDAVLAGHILAPSPAVRLTWARRITEALAASVHVPLDDGSPLFFQVVRADSEADPFRSGQIQVTGRFGMLRPAAGGVPVQRLVLSGAVVGERKDTAVNTTALTWSEN